MSGAEWLVPNSSETYETCGVSRPKLVARTTSHCSKQQTLTSFPDDSKNCHSGACNEPRTFYAARYPLMIRRSLSSKPSLGLPHTPTC